MKYVCFAALLLTSFLSADSLESTSPLMPSQTELQLPTPHFQPPPYKSPFLAVGLSVIYPGLGHVYLGDMQTAGALMGSTGLTLGLATSDFSSYPIRINSIIAMQNISFYGLYAAYRDVRKYNGNSGYSYKMPNDSLGDLSYAPFKWSIIKKPEVWGGLLGSFALMITASHLLNTKDARSKVKFSSANQMLPAMALPIGIGEEAFFRGYLQPLFSEWLTPWGGIALSSAVFGAAHILNAQVLMSEDRWRYYSFALPLITSMGVYFGWLTYKNNSLQESVALHTWYDLIIFTASVLAAQASVTGRTSFAITVPF